MFDITVEDPAERGKHIHVWQNSWGLSTRVIGVMVMIHSDNKGLVLPPRTSKVPFCDNANTDFCVAGIAKIQTILIAVGITAKTTAEDKAKHLAKIEELHATLKKAGVRSDVDDREQYSPPWKFNDWELKGCPLRIEIGPRDLAQEVVSFARRDTGEKGTIPISELSTKVPELLETIQADLYAKADAAYKAHRVQLTEWDKVVPALDALDVVIVPFCLQKDCEEKIKATTKSTDERGQERTGMKSLCIPFEQPEGLVKGETACINPTCERKAEEWTMFGRSY